MASQSHLRCWRVWSQIRFLQPSRSRAAPHLLIAPPFSCLPFIQHPLSPQCLLPLASPTPVLTTVNSSEDVFTENGTIGDQAKHPSFSADKSHYSPHHHQIDEDCYLFVYYVCQGSYFAACVGLLLTEFSACMLVV